MIYLRFRFLSIAFAGCFTLLYHFLLRISSPFGFLHHKTQEQCIGTARVILLQDAPSKLQHFLDNRLFFSYN